MDDSTQPVFAGGELLAGKYRVERMIGSGGMGVVLAAKHEGLNTNVAIKLLRTAALGHTDVVGRFMREARAAVSLRSEHVARVFDVGTLEDGRPYIVMERLEGQDLGDICEAATLPPIGVAVDYVMQACEAIAEAHAAGIVHRDLKPKNLFLTTNVHGQALVKVLDFGISKIDPAHSPGEMALTKTTEIIGSPSYMSPEQLRSARNVDTRTDIWALGVILYELLTGRVPFYAETVTELVLVVVTEPHQPIRSIRPDVPEGLDQIVARCLAKSPDHRYQSVVELVQALEPYTHMVTTTATDRIRNVSHSGCPTPGGNISSSSNVQNPTAIVNGPGSGLAGVPSSGPVIPLVSNSSRPSLNPSSGRVNVHGGTSVAWGETQSAVQPMPGMSSPPGVLNSRAPKGSSVLSVALIAAAAAVFVLVVGGGGMMYYTSKHPTPVPPPAVAGNEGAVPLPPGRKDLPPTPPPTVSTPDVPTPSAMPTDRKPGAVPLPKPPVAAPAAPAPKAAPKPAGGDGLDGIGRH